MSCTVHPPQHWHTLDHSRTHHPSIPKMRYTDRSIYGIHEGDRYVTPRAGTLDRADAVLPWRCEDPLPPPVPPKGELSAPNKPATAKIPGRVTPWLLRRVKTPVPRAAKQAQVTRPPQKVVSADIKGSPKPPSYRSVPQQQNRPSEESLGTVPRGSSGNGAKPASRPVIPSSAVPVHVHTPPNPVLPLPDKSDSRSIAQTHPRSPRSRIRGTHEERSRPEISAATPRHAPLPEPAQAHPPSYHFPEPFPAPPPYRASAEEGSPHPHPHPHPHPPRPQPIRSQSLPRIRKPRSAFEKEAPLPPLPSHPPLPNSAVSRIQAAYKVSMEFGDAVMRQEVRMATPAPEHTRLDPAPTPRAGMRFMSASELEGFRKAARERVDKLPREHETRQRTPSKPSYHVERCSGESRQRAVSAHSGRGNHDMKSRNTAKDKR